jgi:tetratricopeptide (TPR) repeat protein
MAGCSGSRNNQRESLRALIRNLWKGRRPWQLMSRLRKKIGDVIRGIRKDGDFMLNRNLPMAFLQYDKALRLDRNQPGIRYKMGRLFLEKGMAEAQNEFLEVLKVNPQHARPLKG